MEAALTTKNKAAYIQKKVFLYAYLILPITLAVVLVDIFYLDSALLPHLGINGLLLPLYIIIFNLPHIIASFFSFFDGEYVQYYKKHLFLYLPALLLATAILLYVNYELGLAFFILNDVWHGIKQKTGIALILGAKPGLLQNIWIGLTFMVAGLVYLNFLIPTLFPNQYMMLISLIVLIGMGLLFLTTIAKIWESDPKVRFYIFLVSTLFFFSYGYVLTGYIFLAVFVFRFVHDVCAFAFYINHDHNRNKDEKKNWFYGALSAIPLPTLILTPLLGLVFAYLARTITNGIAIGYSIVILICMCHFYLESVMWKRGSPHRANIKLL